MPVLWCSLPIALPILAAIVDFIVGDPWHWLHPVQIMGWGIQAYQRSLLRLCQSPRLQRLAGVGLGLGLPALSGAIAGGSVLLVWQLSPWLGLSIAVVILASCFAGRSLRQAAEDVLKPLSQGNLLEARQRLRLYVGRDTQTLSESEILRAVMENISENATDGVLAPLFYALIGLAIAPAVGIGLAIAYKALSTLDSMVGYRKAPYTYLGWFSARTEDIATWLPCRLAVVTIALWSRRPGHVWHVCRRDAPADPSPNAGWSECAYAAALGVQLGGKNTYQGKVRAKPLLGDSYCPITAATIRQGLQLTRWAFLSWLTLGLVGLIYRYGLNCG
ncbi:MAG: adenosylcobinamide-phosphate synthase CbiB [Leptolyngbyaceae cyanobacterium]